MRDRFDELLVPTGYTPVSKRLQRVAHVTEQRQEVDPIGGRDMRLQFQSGERQQIVDQPVHALNLLQHDSEEPFTGLRIVLRRSLERLDKALQRGEGSSQLMAGIGHEVGAHPLHDT